MKNLQQGVHHVIYIRPKRAQDPRNRGRDFGPFRDLGSRGDARLVRGAESVLYRALIAALARWPEIEARSGIACPESCGRRGARHRSEVVLADNPLHPVIRLALAKAPIPAIYPYFQGQFTSCR